MPNQQKRQTAVNRFAYESRGGAGKAAGKNKRVPFSNRLISLVIPQMLVVLRSIAQDKISGIAKMSELEARMIAELKYGELTMTGLVQIVGNDKSQVSRALKRLLDDKLVVRASIRSPLSLTALGKMHFRKLAPSSRWHSDELLKKLGATEQAFFIESLTRLIDVAAHMLEQERKADAGEPVNKDGRKRMCDFTRLDAPDHELPPNSVMPSRLFALATLLRRSAFLAFKRRTSLSNNECLLLTYIWEHAPVTSSHLTQITGFAKSRSDKALAVLMRDHLIQRSKSVASHDWIYDRAEAGSEIYEDSLTELERREGLLIQAFSVQDLQKFRNLLDRVAANATAMSVRNPHHRQ